ncbi:putative porin [Microbulbifer sp. JMSA003]|uniref:putative porin n=1 Tax=Microbulbifer sp. JMSA003 TaxID=3243369 RepID=UPI004039CD30
MRFKLAALPLMLVAATAGAEEYNSITTVGYSNLDYEFDIFGSEFDADGNQFVAETTYYFSGKESLGPLKEFEYINKASNVSAAFFHNEIEDNNEDSYALAGEYFTKSGFVLGASLTEVDDDSINTASLGYLFTPNFLVEISHTDFDLEFDSTEETYVEFRYNYQLSGSDYIGFDLVTDDDLDVGVFSSKYFTSLGGSRYLTAELSYADYDSGDDYWQIGADYYFNQNTSLGIKLDEEDDMKLAFTHFFSRNVAVEAAYSTMVADNGINIRSFGSDTYRAGSPSPFDIIPALETDVEKFELGLTVQL